MHTQPDIARLCILYAVEPLYNFSDIIPKEISKNLTIGHIGDNPKAYRYIQKEIISKMAGYLKGTSSYDDLVSILINSDIWVNPNEKILDIVMKLVNLFKCDISEHYWKLLHNSNKLKAMEMFNYIRDIMGIEIAGNSQNEAIRYIEDIDLVKKLLRANHYGEYSIRESLSMNPNAHIVEKLLSDEWAHLIDYSSFASNPSDIAIDYLISHPDKINWFYLVENPNPRALKILFAHIEKTKENVYLTHRLESNPGFIDLLMENPELVKYAKPKHFSGNSNPKLIKYLESHPEYLELIDLEYLCVCNHGVLTNRYGLRFIKILNILLS